MRRLVICALVFLTTSASAETLDQILAKNLDARGGAAKVRAIHALRLTGHATFGGGDFSVDAGWGSVQKRPGFTRTELTLQGLTQVTAYDGKKGWSVSPFGGRRDADEASEDDARSLAQAADLEGPLVDWRQKGHRIDYLGTEDVDGTPAHKLRVLRKDGDTQYVYIDPDSWLEIRITTVHEVRGTEDISETDLGAYQNVNGVWLPFSMESGGPGERRSFRVTVERAEFDPTIDDAMFKLPKPNQTITRLIVAGPPEKVAAVVALPEKAGTGAFDAGTISGLGARNIGSAAMSGRVSAVAARNEGGKTVIYVGAASGGVWKSLDGGTTFKPMFDKQPVQSIGAIAIAPSDPKTVWVGTGESWMRNSVSVGNGIYRSTDEGVSCGRNQDSCRVKVQAAIEALSSAA